MKTVKCSILGMIVLLISSISFAGTGYTVKIVGDQERRAVVGALTKSYCTDATISFSKGSGDYVTVEGPGGLQKINISDSLLAKLQKYSSDGLAGTQLVDICPTQAQQLQKAWGDASKNRQQRANVSGVFAPDSMRLIADGDVCDERSFSGDVVEAALETSGGKSVSVIELHHRNGKSMPFKGKRLYVDVQSQRAIPFVWASTGKCVRKYDTKPLSQVKLQSMMMTCETAQAADFSEIGQDGSVGSHFTEGVIVISGQ